MKSLRIRDPEGVERRKGVGLREGDMSLPVRTFYGTLSGWDKLAPFGIFIHGVVYRFSRRILWLEVNSANKNPSVIASHYLSTVQQLEGVPVRMCCDGGMGSTTTGILQKLFRWHDNDKFAGEKSFIQGRAVQITV